MSEDNLSIKGLLLPIDIFRYLDSNELDFLIAHSKTEIFAPGQTLLQQGKANNTLFVILRGSALVTARILGQSPVNMAILKPGDCINEETLITNHSFSGTVIANDDLHCLMITRDCWEALTLFFPEMKFKVARAVIEGVCAKMKIICDKICVIMQQIGVNTKFTFSDLMAFLGKPKAINFDDAAIDPTNLVKTEFFNSFNPHESEILLQHFHLIQAPARCPLIEKDDTKNCYYLILRGAIQANVIYQTKVAKLAVFGPAAFVGGTSFIDQQPEFINFTSCERVILLRIKAEDLAKIKTNDIFLWYKIYHLIATSLVSLEYSVGKLFLWLNSESYKGIYV